MAAANNVASFRFPACGGAKTADVLDDQLGALSATTTMVTITIGGNDAGFADVMTDCRFGSTSTCTNAVNAAKASPPAPCRPAGQHLRRHPGTGPQRPTDRARLSPAVRDPLLRTAGHEHLQAHHPQRAADVLATVTADRAAAAAPPSPTPDPPSPATRLRAQPWIRDVTGVIEAYHPNADGYRYGYLPALNAVTG